MPNIYDFAINLIQNNQQMASSPMGKNFLEALKNQDHEKGQEMANNLLKSQGIDKETAMNDIQQNIRSRIPNLPFF